MISIKHRAEAITRGKNALRHLEEHPATSRNQLGHAREILNRIYTWTDESAVRDAVEGIETLASNVHRRHPDHTIP